MEHGAWSVERGASASLRLGSGHAPSILAVLERYDDSLCERLGRAAVKRPHFREAGVENENVQDERLCRSDVMCAHRMNELENKGGRGGSFPFREIEEHAASKITRPYAHSVVILRLASRLVVV